ncbi:hypothetical protein [Oceanobacillus profundus]|uniref:Uncharacterized protein n=1 Tax=Oceanobacillus profundus TaxID=372463 RepID=A0A417YGP1_9BACI|nr:hypothetical protein [Oceanobacillus profundus]MBR2246102.1 hypothetical protein [Bacilli bacterium]MBR3119773.1 hypothetical protein [Oceanobacillus sp.]RHW31922.1 hypothetical protein D1B32_11835 [Oceanobacillus profundus]
MSQLEFENEKEQEVTFGTQLEQIDSDEKKDDNAAETNEESVNVEENGQFSLFDAPEEKKEEPKKKKSSNAKKAKPEDKVDTEYTVYYAGHQVPVPESDMTLETLRSYLEMDFPELSKERTEMLIDKKEKQVVPVVKGAKKG